jgi:hypothetical protein
MRDARTRDERVKRGDLAGAVGDARALAADVEAAARRVFGARAAIAAATDTRDRRVARGATAAQITHHERYLGRLRRDLEAESRRAAAGLGCIAASRMSSTRPANASLAWPSARS